MKITVNFSLWQNMQKKFRVALVRKNGIPASEILIDERENL